MECTQKREDCMFIVGGQCDILNNTHFKDGKRCPFYKQGIPDTPTDHYIDGQMFREIRNTDGKYLVSERGDVISKQRGNMKVYHTKVGHPYVQLIINGKETTRHIAQLVADAYINGTGKVDHIDGNIKNCDRWNLRRIGDEE